MKNLLLLLTLIALIAGCATTQYEGEDGVKRWPTSRVDIFREGNQPSRPYIEIGEVSEENFGTHDESARKALVEKAKRKGADALIMLPRLDNGYQFNMFGESGNRFTWRGVAIVWKDEPHQPTNQPKP